MQVSIIIPTHKRHQALLNLLQSIYQQDLPPKELEVHVVSNLKDSSLQKKLDRHFKDQNNLNYWEVGDLGVNRARNLGVNNAQGAFLVFLDDDCYLNHKDYLSRTLKQLKRWPEISAIGGPYTLPAKSNSMEQTYNSICRHWLESSVRKSHYTINLVGGNMIFRQSVFSNGLRFNEDITFGGAETDFNIRLVKLGHRLKYDPNLSVEHRLHLNLKTFFTKAFWPGCPT